MQLGVYLHGSSPFSPKETIDDYIDLVNRYEEANIHSIWFADHLIRTPDPNQSPLYETWTLMAGLARETTTMIFGTMVSPVTFRKFGPFAKQVVTTDHLLEGRLILGLGAGWSFKEYPMWGVDLPSTKQRLDTLEEWLEAFNLLFESSEPVDYDGRYVNLKQAYLNPKPVIGAIPLLIGGGGEQVTLKLVAKYGSYSNFGGDRDTIKHKLNVLWNHCDEVGRDRTEITPTTNQALILGKTKDDVEEGIKNYLDRFRTVGRDPPSRDSFADNRLVGTVDEVANQLGELEDIGIDLTVMTINDPHSSELVNELVDSL